ncbi:MAG: ornithine cyclodeaminase family protein [Candidatus Brocadiia bacterium]
MSEHKTILIDRGQVEEFLTMARAVEAVEEAFRAYGEGNAQLPPKPYLQFPKGDLRCMPAYLPGLGLASVKNVNVHPENTELPTVMATITIFDPYTGFARAIMDGTYLTAVRTGAAGGIAARYLAREDSRIVSFAGAGRQARTQLAALVETMPQIEEVLIHDIDQDRARQFCQYCDEEHDLEARYAELNDTVREADILTTVTPSREPFVSLEYLKPGTHVNAIGADAPGKQELELEVLEKAKIVLDSWKQASHGGEINCAVAEGLIREEDIHANIGEVVTGRKTGRECEDEITVFDSTGLAIQDCACAVQVYRELTAEGRDISRLTTVDFLSRF